MPDQQKVLLVVNEREEFRVAELAELLEGDGISYDMAIGREEAISRIAQGGYAGVYLADCAVDLGSERNPSGEAFALIGDRPYRRFNTYIASGLEVVMSAREKGLPVLVGDEEAGKGSVEAFNRLGAKTMNILTDNVTAHYKALARMISTDKK